MVGQVLYALVVQDHFTEYVNAYLMEDEKANMIAQIFCDDYVP